MPNQLDFAASVQKSIINTIFGIKIEDEEVNEERESVFELGYVPSSKDLDFDIRSSGYFSLSEKTGAALSFDDEESFWKIIVISIAEVHEESFSLHNTLSDSMQVFSTGAKPVDITLTGYVLLGGSDDHNYEFLRKYVDGFRARKAAADERRVYFTSQDTQFAMVIESISLAHTIEMETYVCMTIAGSAYHYSITSSEETLKLGYYGEEGNQTNQPIDHEITKEEEKKPETIPAPKEFVGPPKPSNLPPAIKKDDK